MSHYQWDGILLLMLVVYRIFEPTDRNHLFFLNNTRPQAVRPVRDHPVNNRKKAKDTHPDEHSFVLIVI